MICYYASFIRSVNICQLSISEITSLYHVYWCLCYKALIHLAILRHPVWSDPKFNRGKAICKTRVHTTGVHNVDVLNLRPYLPVVIPLVYTTV